MFLSLLNKTEIAICKSVTNTLQISLTSTIFGFLGKEETTWGHMNGILSVYREHDLDQCCLPYRDLLLLPRTGAIVSGICIDYVAVVARDAIAGADSSLVQSGASPVFSTSAALPCSFACDCAVL